MNYQIAFFILLGGVIGVIILFTIAVNDKSIPPYIPPKPWPSYWDCYMGQPYGCYHRNYTCAKCEQEGFEKGMMKGRKFGYQEAQYDFKNKEKV